MIEEEPNQKYFNIPIIDQMFLHKKKKKTDPKTTNCYHINISIIHLIKLQIIRLGSGQTGTTNKKPKIYIDI